MDKFQLSDLCKRLDCRGSNELECTFPDSEATVFIPAYDLHVHTLPMATRFVRYIFFFSQGEEQEHVPVHHSFPEHREPGRSSWLMPAPAGS